MTKTKPLGLNHTVCIYCQGCKRGSIKIDDLGGYVCFRHWIFRPKWSKITFEQKAKARLKNLMHPS